MSDVQERADKTVTLEIADREIRSIQEMIKLKAGEGFVFNSFEPKAATQKVVREDGVVYVNDICYGTKYPNSYLDIYYPDTDTKKKRPTVIYYHGGGFFMGSKSTGDPLAVKEAGDLSFIGEILAKGYNLVMGGYALTPEYRFPTQLEQVNQTCAFLMEHADEYGITMDDVFLMGGSAGADLSEIYGLMVLDEDYAAQVGIEVALKKEQVRGLILDEPALNTQSFNNRNMNIMLKCWLGEDDMQNRNNAKLVDIPRHIKHAYFPSYLVASNKDPFFEEHCDQLAAVLDQIGVPYDYYKVDRSKGVYDHGFMMQYQTDPYAREAFDRMLQFMANCLDSK